MLVRKHGGTLWRKFSFISHAGRVPQNTPPTQHCMSGGWGGRGLKFWWSARLFRSGRTPGMTRFVVNGGACLRNARVGTCMYRVVHTAGCIKHDTPFADWRMSGCAWVGSADVTDVTCVAVCHCFDVLFRRDSNQKLKHMPSHTIAKPCASCASLKARREHP